MTHLNEAFVSVNLRSKLLNHAEIARKVGLTPQNFHDKLNSRGKAKPFTAAELMSIEELIRAELEL